MKNHFAYAIQNSDGTERSEGCQMVYFQAKNLTLGKFLEGIGVENVYIFYGHMEYFTDIWDIS
jgi:hypothetical protein